MKKIKLLYAAAEISPYATAGGLGEVGKSFPKALSGDTEYEIYRVMPLHKLVKAPTEYLMDFPIGMEQSHETCVVKKVLDENGITTYLLGNDRYFYRDNIYGYEDDGVRFFFFCKAIIELIKHLPFLPDIVHTNDWHTGILPLLLKKEFPQIKSVYTIHNISYHGYIPAPYLSGLSLKELYPLGWPEWLNFMKAGIIYSDLLTTVSPGYCEEIKQPGTDCGMISLLESRKDKMIGILNGIDIREYHPGNEDELEYPYDYKQPELKKKNRSWLKEHYKLVQDNRPLAVMITRLDYSKGIDVLLKAISLCDFNNFQLIVLGSGNPYYQGLLANAAASYPTSIAVDFIYSAKMAKKIYAGADIYLMPSLFEPCGIGLLYAMRYGTVPVVNPVGGLKDTVIDYEKNPKEATGFYMKEWSGQAFYEALSRALKLYDSPEWNRLISNCMNYNSSWDHSAKEYKAYYKDLLNMD
jgi:starch synthase